MCVHAKVPQFKILVAILENIITVTLNPLKE